jgi:hypothetical protein
MKWPTISVVLLLLSIICPAFAQEDVKAKHDAYYLCINNIEIEPYKAFGYCSDYLNKYPNDDKRLIEFAGQFVTAFNKIDRYLKSVPKDSYREVASGLFIYTPDLRKVIPETGESKSKYKIVIHRSFRSPEEDKMLSDAEALYADPQNPERDLFKNWRYYSFDYAKLPDGEPKWGNGGNSIFQANLVTTSAVSYYYDISTSLRHNDGKLSGSDFKYISSDLKYESEIKKYGKFERSGKIFTNVYVANMTLTWGAMCGGLCGEGFTRNKVVVLSDKGDIIEMFLDDPINSTSWIS